MRNDEKGFLLKHDRLYLQCIIKLKEYPNTELAILILKFTLHV